MLALMKLGFRLPEVLAMSEAEMWGWVQASLPPPKPGGKKFVVRKKK